MQRQKLKSGGNGRVLEFKFCFLLVSATVKQREREACGRSFILRDTCKDPCGAKWLLLVGQVASLLSFIGRVLKK
jgi:hypothetical protein